jgi:hypothetical protein
MPGQSTGFHDHGESSGAFVVATGILEEHRPGQDHLVIAPGKARAFGPDYAHDVRNASLAPAVSIHAYSPPLTDMNEYELEGDSLVLRERAPAEAEELARESGGTSHMQTWRLANRTGALGTCFVRHAPDCDGYLRMKRMRRPRSEGYTWLIFSGRLRLWTSTFSGVAVLSKPRSNFSSKPQESQIMRREFTIGGNSPQK